MAFMLYSMTGFGSAVCKEGDVSVSVELKAVNNRYFKLLLKLTDGYGALEPRIESHLRSAIERGTINAHIRIAGGRNDVGHQVNTTVLESYIKQLSDTATTLGYTNYCPPLDRLVTLPGVILTEYETSEAANEQVWTLLKKAILDALDALKTMRKIEGESMAND